MLNLKALSLTLRVNRSRENEHTTMRYEPLAAQAQPKSLHTHHPHVYAFGRGRAQMK